MSQQMSNSYTNPVRHLCVYFVQIMQHTYTERKANELMIPILN